MLWLPYEQKQTWINLELRWDLKKKSKEPRCGKLQWRQLNHLILEMLCSNTGEEKNKHGFRNTLSWPGTTEMEMPFSDVCWLIKFITTSWETLISSLLTRPQSCLHIRLWQSNWGFCRVASFGSWINNLILSKITRSCPILARFLLRAPCVMSQLWLGGTSGTLERTQHPGISPCFWFGRTLQKDRALCMSVVWRSWQLRPVLETKPQRKLVSPVIGSYKGVY